MQKSLDEKLARIAANPSCNDFILADAKDADMAFGIAAPGVKDKDAPEHKRYRTIHEFRSQIRWKSGELRQSAVAPVSHGDPG